MFDNVVFTPVIPCWDAISLYFQRTVLMVVSFKETK